MYNTRTLPKLNLISRKTLRLPEMSCKVKNDEHRSQKAYMTILFH